MKDDIHPKYQKVLFKDTSNGKCFVIGSTLQPKGKETYEGVEYPVHYVTVSSESHPFFTGSNQFIDTEGRVDKFKKRYQKKAAEGVQGPTKDDPLKKKVK
ncbi:MAG: type B 50S ribosomal protein L31 [Chlamydiales bacterium]|nr:type B 50S ribosomal protein L31 [Chlamydiales bacterium]